MHVNFYDVPRTKRHRENQAKSSILAKGHPCNETLHWWVIFHISEPGIAYMLVFLRMPSKLSNLMQGSPLLPGILETDFKGQTWNAGGCSAIGVSCSQHTCAELRPLQMLVRHFSATARLYRLYLLLRFLLLLLTVFAQQKGKRQPDCPDNYLQLYLSVSRNWGTASLSLCLIW